MIKPNKNFGKPVSSRSLKAKILSSIQKFEIVS